VEHGLNAIRYELAAIDIEPEGQLGVEKIIGLIQVHNRDAAVLVSEVEQACNQLNDLLGYFAA
jgi:hypothetical protein